MVRKWAFGRSAELMSSFPISFLPGHFTKRENLTVILTRPCFQVVGLLYLSTDKTADKQTLGSETSSNLQNWQILSLLRWTFPWGKISSQKAGGLNLC